MKESFSITYETLHVDNSRGELDNAHNISDQGKKKKMIDMQGYTPSDLFFL